MAYRFVVFAVLIIVGAFNREMTGILLWLSFIAAYPRKWQWSTFYGVLLFTVLFGLRLIVTADPSPYSIQYVWEQNTQTWQSEGAILYGGLLCPLWLFLYAPARGSLRYRFAIILLPYLGLFALFATWQETRLLMPLLILGIAFLPKDTHA